jgi:hypothetical protein
MSHIHFMQDQETGRSYQGPSMGCRAIGKENKLNDLSE